MFQKVDDASFISGEHEMLRFWRDRSIFTKLKQQNAGKPRWSFVDGPITANNPMGVHHAWGRTYKDAFQRYYSMLGRELRFQNGFDCQGLWVEVEVEKELKLSTKKAIQDYGIDRFVRECKKRVLKFAARQTEQSIRLGYWMEWDDPDQLRKLAEGVGSEKPVAYTTARGQAVTKPAEQIVEKLGNPEWGGSYFTFSTENNETIWTFLKKCFERGKVYQGHDVMPWSGRAGSAYSQMEVADGRKLTTHRSCFVKFPITSKPAAAGPIDPAGEFLLVWTTTPWTLTSNVAAAVNPDLVYLKVRSKKDGAIYYFAKDNLDTKRGEKEFKEGFGRPEWQWPKDVPKLKSLGQLFKELGGHDVEAELKGADLVGWSYKGPFDELDGQNKAIQNTSTQEFSEFAASIREECSEAVESLELHNLLLTLVPQGVSSDVLESLETGGTANEQTLEYVASGYAHAFREAIHQIIGICTSARLIGIDQEKPQRLQDVSQIFKNLDLDVVCTEQWDCALILDDRSYDRVLPKPGIVKLIDWKILRRNQPNDEVAFAPCFQLKLADLYSQLAVATVEQLLMLNGRSGVDCHRVIDGGRDSRGNPNVTAGEGTGIVHIAPGCGDIDHTIGQQLGLVTIAPLKEDGTYGEGFGPFTDRKAVDPATAQMVFDSLKEKGLLFSVEQYPHIYPFCWRTGDELVFRLVDEWFINMDWRDEIKDVTKSIHWLPDSLQGQDREVEWLTTMRDWMISKKRFWGLALPIWVNPNDPTDFDVIGTLAELKERAVEGWNDFEGNTPHRPWIDQVKIKSEKTGAVLERVPDVGNPWLDAGIVPFSTLNYNENYSTSLLNWKDWYPADLVSESFPGQFRNWFYSLLALGTMMRYEDDETGEVITDPLEKRPFKNLFAYRLVMNEEGKPMHKSDGTAIWFEEAAEQLGVDALRWLYLAQNPAQDLRFGTRHPEQQVPIETPEGRISETKEGVPTCKVTSKPVDEARRQVLIPLWNSYAFFVNYARLDGFTPDLPKVPFADRPEIDRWLLSNLQSLIATCRAGFETFDTGSVTSAAAQFIDDLSNWYIRRNRRRFWRARSEEASGGRQSADAPETAWEADKLAAYQTLYETLVALTKLLAPCIPFLAERMYQNLVVGTGTSGAPESVHLCEYPGVDPALLDESLNHRMAIAQRVVSMGHRLRESADRRVRQPLAELKYACANAQDADDIAKLADVIADELNVKKLTPAGNLDDLVHYSYKPNLKTLGPKLGKLLNAVKTVLPTLPEQIMSPLRRGEKVTLKVNGEEVVLSPEDVMVSTEQASDWAAADDAGVQIALATKLTPELAREGAARDFIRQVQQLRKDHDLDENERIVITWQSAEPEIAAAVEEWRDTILSETRGNRIEPGAASARPVNIGSTDVQLEIKRES